MIIPAPWWCLVALLGLLPWIGPWRGANVGQNTLRTLLFIALAFALARPQWIRDDASAQHVFVLDLTESVQQSSREAALGHAIRFAEDIGKSDSHAVVIGGSGDDVTALRDAFGTVDELLGSGPSGSTPLSDAISSAEMLIPRTSCGSVTIASDGLTTRPDDARAIAALRLREIPIGVVSLSPVRSDPRPVAVRENDLRVGSTGVVTATIAAHDVVSPGEVSLRIGEDVIATAAYDGSPRQELALEFEPKEAGFVDAEIVLTASGGTSSLSVVLAVQEPRYVSYMPGLQRDGAAELSRLLGSGFEVQTIDPSDENAFRAALAKAELVVMDDCNADSIAEPIEKAIMNAVTNEGLGLVMSGGRSSFGSGGWHDRLVETVLPVELVQKEEKRDPSTTLVVVIDTSGSMSGVRVQLAKEVARLAMRRLLPHDKVGIVEFYGAKRWAAPIQPASNAIELQRALNRMDAGGGTVILPALEEAFYGLQNVDTRYKHVLVLTDGGVEAGNFESLMRRMAGEGINVSTVLAGGGYHSEFLVNIANWGKGRFYNVPNRFNLPEILLKQPSTAKLPAYRPGQHSVRARGGSGWWGDVDTASIPELGGYVETKSRPGSEVLLETVDDKHPVITTWRYGAGRVTAIATEPVGEGTRPWREWPDYGKTLARILERSSGDTRDPFRFRFVHDGGELQVHAVRQLPRTDTQASPLPRGRILPSGISGQEIALRFVAKSPDRFVATTAAADVGEEVRIECWSSTTAERRHAMVAPAPVVDESSVDPASAIDLPALAEAASGQSFAVDDELLNDALTQLTEIPAAGKRMVSLAPWLFAIALILFLAEIVWRRRPLTDTKTSLM